MIKGLPSSTLHRTHNMVVLQNGLSEDNLSPAFWTVAEAANRWRGIRERLLGITDVITEDSGDTLESLCFIIDEILTADSFTGSFRDYVEALQEVADVLLGECAEPAVQALILSEIQKVVLPS